MKLNAQQIGTTMVPKTADLSKLSQRIEPGQIVNAIDGQVYRVLSKIATADSFVFRLANLQGQPVQTPANFHPISKQLARFGSWLKFVLAYNKDLTKIVNSMIEQHGYPTDPKMDWSKYVQTAMAPALASVTPDFELQDEAIYQVIVRALVDRDILASFSAAIKKFPKAVQQLPLERQISEYLKKAFVWRIQEAKAYVQELQPREEMSIEQPGSSDEGEETYSLLDTEEHATGTQDFNTTEAHNDFTAFRDEFGEWLNKKTTPKSSKQFTTLLDIYWEQAQETDLGGVKISDLAQEWLKRTNLSFDSLKAYRDKLPSLLEDFVRTHGNSLKGDYEVAALIKHMLPKKKQKSRPAHASSVTASADKEYVRADGQPFEGGAAGATHIALTPTGEVEIVFSNGDRTQNSALDKSMLKDMVQRGYVKEAASDKPTCPHCGSSSYGLMPTDFETAKCNDCGKNWDHGIVEGINDPKAASTENTKSDEPFRDSFPERKKLEEDVSRFSKELKKFPKGPTGMTLDATKATPEWQEAKRNYNRAFQALREFNSKHTAAENLGQCSCEWEECPLGHKAGGCPNPADHMLEIYGHKTRYCQPCTDATIEYIRLEQGTGDADNTVKILSSEKEAMLGHDFVNEDGQAIRPDITPGDTGRVPHGKTQGSLKFATLVKALPCCGSVTERHKSDCEKYNKVFNDTVDKLYPKKKADYADDRAAEDQRLFQENNPNSNVTTTLDSFRPTQGKPLNPPFDPLYPKSAVLTPKGQAAWDAIKASGDKEFRYYGAGGGILSNGTKIHSHTISSLRKEGLLVSGPGYNLWKKSLEGDGPEDKTPWSWVVTSQSKTAGKWSVTVRNNQGRMRSEIVSGVDYKSAERAAQKKMKSGEKVVSMTVASTKEAAGVAPAAPAAATPAPAPAAPAPATAPGTEPANPTTNTVQAPPAGTSVALPNQQQQDEPMRKTVPPELPGKKWHMTSEKKTASILEDAFKYFIEGKKDGGLGDVFNERYTRTGKGEDKYMATSRLMMDFEYAFQRQEDGTLSDIDNYRADAEEALRAIIGDDPNYSEQVDKTSASPKLKTEQNTPEMEGKIEALIASHPLTEIHENCNPYFEHGQWWVVCGPCGATWSVVDVGHHFGDEGDIDLEEVDNGDDSCAENAHISSNEMAPKEVECAGCGKVFEVGDVDEQGHEVGGKWYCGECSKEASADKTAYEPGANSGMKGSNDGTYIYRADIWCEKCAVAIAEKLTQEGKAPADIINENTYDSDDFPKGPFFEEESDAPEHCAGCGIFLENPLTTDGREYMQGMVDQALASGRGEEPHIKEWMDFYGYHPEGDNMKDHEASSAKDVINALPQRGKPKSPEQLGLQRKTDNELRLEGVKPEGEKQAAGDDFNATGLSQDQITVVCACLNMSSEQGKPEASAENLRHFQTSAVFAAIQEAIDGDKLTPAGVEVAQTILGNKEASMEKEAVSADDLRKERDEQAETLKSGPSSGEDKGTYVDVIYQKGGIKLKPTEQLKKEIAEGGPQDVQTYASIWELMEDFFTNGWENVAPEDIGALTSGEIFSDPNGNLYWHERYQIEDMLEELKQGNEVFMQYGGNLYNEEEPSTSQPPNPDQGTLPFQSSEKQADGERKTIQTKHGEMSYRDSDVVNPDDYTERGGFNPHNVRPWLIHNEFGTLCIVYSSNEQDALDEAVDADKMDSCLVSDADYAEAEREGHADEYASLGNAGEPFDLTYIGMIELPNAQYGTPSSENIEDMARTTQEEEDLNDKESSAASTPVPDPKKAPQKPKERMEKEALDPSKSDPSYENHPVITLLWNYLKRDPEYKDRVQTAYGTKTKQGLVLSIARAMKEGGKVGSDKKKMCKRCHKKPAMTSYATCKECHDQSMTEAEKATGVE